MSIHDEIALKKKHRTWYLEDWSVFATLDADDVVISFEVISSLIEDVELLLEEFQCTTEGKVWLIWKGYDWAERHAEVTPSLASWHKARKYDGKDIDFIAESIIRDKPQWFTHMEQIKECALELLANDPLAVVCMCTWVAVLNTTQTKFCFSIQERLVALDHRLNPSTDWVYAAGDMFAEGEHLEVMGEHLEVVRGEEDDMTETETENDENEVSKLHKRAHGTGSLV